MENKFKESQFIEQIMVIGENQKHPAALIVPANDFCMEWCKSNNVGCTALEELISHDKFIAKIESEIHAFNQSFGQWEQVKKFELLHEEWSIEGGELTPTLKLKRKIIMSKFGEHVDRIYG